MTSKIGENKVIATPISPYEQSTKYRLVIFVDKGENYQMNFETSF
ncbi:hypothetical protein MHH81_03605 [Psychrobacillus sp. FSL H8-0484]